MVIRRVISGGQTGADFAGLLAARDCGIATGGTAPKGYRTENGSDARLAGFGLVEHESADYRPRTRWNVEDSNLTLIFTGGVLDGGSALTVQLCNKLGKPYKWFRLLEHSPVEIADWLIKQYSHDVVNIAGNRESKTPGIEDATRKWLVRLFKIVQNQ